MRPHTDINHPAMKPTFTERFQSPIAILNAFHQPILVWSKKPDITTALTGRSRTFELEGQSQRLNTLVGLCDGHENLRDVADVIKRFYANTC